ncbi:MAG: hypothetical protein B6245_10945 [Desulfobacteraceae bacterium 4572_88]|nr:MAG: hypothetical protein B6245_10945 [Desulfobacteraceae bacterium 4572_88]
MNKSRQHIPYPELFQAFTDAASQQLQEQTSKTCHLLAKSAYEGLEESLLQRLTYATLPLSDLKFSAFFGQACKSERYR